ncbi:hypothetical protein [Actinoplanes regularis]|uniref:hypothetical protein n=1 Tax=Actinoplanes regularis TaxID=52697 RepID=UPI0024A2A0AF|nr:hypothetical protein [Actinoplanes regularis]GLW35683.1 hypothetical protein Areg01_86180 [Actinoplanes regularis]
MPNNTEPWPAAPPPARRVADAVREADAMADWRLPRELYRQVIAMLPEPPPTELLGALAEALAGLISSYAGRIELLATHTLAVLAAVEGIEILDDPLFLRLYHDERFIRTGETERRPPPLQAVVETCRRVRDAELFRDLLRGAGGSAALCGSVAYGPCYNVRTESDLDLVVVVGETGLLATIADVLARLPGVSDADVARFAARARIFAGTYDDGNTSFSHKVVVRADGAADPLLPAGGPAPLYRISLHVLTRPLLRYVLVDPATRLTRDDAGRARTMRDYRETVTDRTDVHRTFAGRQYARDPIVEPAEDGHLRTTSIYEFDDTDAYCLGFVQSLLITARSEPLWDDLGIRPELAAFQRKLRERLRTERARCPYNLMLLSLAHVRREVLAPHVVRALDGY